MIVYHQNASHDTAGPGAFAGGSMPAPSGSGSVTRTQVPLLGNIPYLGNLFKHTQVSTSNQELIFFITPRIIQT